MWRRVVARIGVELAEFQLERLGDDAVEEVAVVAGDQDRAGVRLKERLEPLDAEQVEVVRRLVEQEQVVFEREQSRQGQPHRPAARERGEPARRAFRRRIRGRARIALGARFHLVTAGGEERFHRVVVFDECLRVALFHAVRARP